MVAAPSRKRLPAKFYTSASGAEPVREWLRSLSSDDRQVIGTDMLNVELGWPIGMPVCRAIKGQRGLWEIRSTLRGGRIARIFFAVHEGSMLLLHGFEKKSQKTPQREIGLAARRMKGLNE